MRVLCVILGVICFFDYKRQKIPNVLVLITMLSGLVRSVYLKSVVGAGEYLVLTAVVVFLLYPLFRIGGLGAGDVKLMSVCAGYFPAPKVFSFLFISLLVSAIFSIIQVCRERNAQERVSYFCEYCVAIVKSGKWSRYLPKKRNEKIRGICMTGPILCSVLLRLGGVY